MPLNRDRNGATNIGTNFRRLFEGEAPIRSLSEDDSEQWQHMANNFDKMKSHEKLTESKAYPFPGRVSYDSGNFRRE